MRSLLTRLVLAAASLTIAVAAHASGTRETVYFQSPALDGQLREMQVYLPEGYSDPQNADRSYPVVYFLHGCVCGTTYGYTVYWTYFQLEYVLNVLIANGTLMPVIAIGPDACGGAFCGSYYTNSELYGNYEDYMVQDVVSYVDQHYRTIDSRDFRYIIGHSMGGYGAMRLALRFPEVYGAVASLSGPLETEFAAEIQIDLLLAENGGVPPYEWDPEDGLITEVMFARSGAFSPNLDNPDYFVDFPYDEYGLLRSDVMARWHPHNPPHLAWEMVEDQDEAPRIYFDCGLQDEHLEYPVNVAFADSLTQLGVAYECHWYNGGHYDQLSTRWPHALGFLVPSAATAGDLSLGSHVSIRVTPNPMSDDTRISYTVPDRTIVTLTTHDASGRVVCCLFDSVVDAGAHTVSWNGADAKGNPVPAGVYFVKLRTSGDQTTSRRLTVVR